MPAPSLDLIINVADPRRTGLLSLVDNQVVAAPGQKLPKFVRNDGIPLRLRFVKPNTTGERPFDDVNVSSATVRAGVGLPDLTPTAGTFYLQVGSTLTANRRSSRP